MWTNGFDGGFPSVGWGGGVDGMMVGAAGSG